jgi:CheY-like chemotaxis protein
MNRGNVLLIDDSISELRLYKEAFKDTGYPKELVTFSDAHLAYDYIVKNHEKIFLIICDVNMPGMTGPDLLKKINENHELKMQAIPFMFFSNSENEKDIEAAYSLSAQGYFHKPTGIEELTRLFQRIIDYWSSARIPRTKHHFIDKN